MVTYATGLVTRDERLIRRCYCSWSSLRIAPFGFIVVIGPVITFMDIGTVLLACSQVEHPFDLSRDITPIIGSIVLHTTT